MLGLSLFMCSKFSSYLLEGGFKMMSLTLSPGGYRQKAVFPGEFFMIHICYIIMNKCGSGLQKRHKLLDHFYETSFFIDSFLS